jgi:HSP20 family protein
MLDKYLYCNIYYIYWVNITLNIKNIFKNNWLNKFIGHGKGNTKPDRNDGDPISELESMQQEMSEMFNQYYNVAPIFTKEMVSDHQIPAYDKKPLGRSTLYGCALTVGLDDMPQVIEFRTTKSFAESGTEKELEASPSVLFGSNWDKFQSHSAPSHKTAERESFVDISSTDGEIKVVLEILGTKEQDIAINTYGGNLEVLANRPQGTYSKLIELPQDIDTETAKFRYNNGILEVTFKKRKKNAKSMGREILVD